MPKIIKKITVVNETFYECEVTQEQAELFLIADSYTMEEVTTSLTFSHYQDQTIDSSTVYFLDSQFPNNPPMG